MSQDNTSPEGFPLPPAEGEALCRQHFAYPLPEERIAQQGLVTRSDAKLLHFNKGHIEDGRFSQLAARLPPRSLLILNTTKVFPSRVLGRRSTGGKVELFLLNPTPKQSPNQCFAAADDGHWAMVKPLKKLAEGECIQLAANAMATIITKGDGQAKVRLTAADGEVLAGEALLSWLSEHGIVPLPPYIRRESGQPASREQHASDVLRYQTVYADKTGSVAAPTAGLHFDEEAMAALTAAGHEFAPLTLHVGAGTFLPVKTEEISAHTMHAEHYNAPTATLAAIDAARQQGRPIIAVGTTSFRCLESLRRLAGGSDKPLAPLGDQWRATELFVYPEQRGHRFCEHFFSGILTNFHQPESTLLMLMAALLGYDPLMAAYRHALAKDYRFLSYGDSGLYLF